METKLVRDKRDIFYYKYTESYKFWIVNPVNTVGIMGKGLALQFKKKMPSHFENYKEAIKDNKLSIGHVFFDEDNKVIAFPTKKHWKSKAKAIDIQIALKDMHQQAIKNHVESIAIPKLGSGLGGLDFDTEVLPLIQKEFKNTSLKKVVIAYGMGRM